MDQYMDSAYDVTGQLFGPDSGIPSWAWLFVVVALFWKVVVPQTKSVRELADDRDAEMLAQLEGNEKGKKNKK
jgi:hypothetical protein